MAKPHIYRWRGEWYCRLDAQFQGYQVRQLGIPKQTPAAAFFAAAYYHHWAVAA